MRRCFYHTDLGQIQIQIALIRYLGSTRGLLAKPSKKNPKSPIRPAGSHFAVRAVVELLTEH